jgi:hypothetical protein
MIGMRKNSRPQYPLHVICIERGTYRIDLQVRKIYRAIKPAKNDPTDMIRVIDDSAEDYLYPADWFVPIEHPAIVKRKLAVAAG